MKLEQRIITIALAVTVCLSPIMVNTINPLAVSVSAATVQKTDISDAIINDLKPEYTWNGKAIKPQFSVRLPGQSTSLNSKTDYSVSYSKNKDIGTAKVTIKGKGKYKGTITKTFKIVPLDLSRCIIKLNKSYKYIGDSVKPKPSIYLSVIDELFATNSSKIASSNYTVTYKNNDRPGIATITVTGKNNCKGTLTANFDITPRKALIKKTIFSKDYTALIWPTDPNTVYTITNGVSYQLDTYKGYTYAIIKNPSRAFAITIRSESRPYTSSTSFTKKINISSQAKLSDNMSTVVHDYIDSITK